MTRARSNYHHGELRTALIDAAAAIIAELGIEGFSLREAARRAGVSPSAPAHHFGSAKGLLTEVALVGYRKMGQYLAGARVEGDADLTDISLAYVRFAIDNPGMFRLMFRNDLVNRADERYVSESSEALAPFATAAMAYSEKRGMAQNQGIFAVWSAIHGMAHLVLEEKVNALFDAADSRELVDKHLQGVVSMLWALA